MRGFLHGVPLSPYPSPTRGEGSKARTLRQSSRDDVSEFPSPLAGQGLGERGPSRESLTRARWPIAA
jgi:hypothetical protein